MNEEGIASAARKRVYFTFAGPEAKDVSLVGSFNNWDERRALKKDRQGNWKTWMMLVPGRYEYRFLVDGKWCNDPGEGCVANPFGSENSVRNV